MLLINYFRKFFLNYYEYIIAFSILTIIVTAYFHIQLHVYGKSLDHWLLSVKQLHNEHQNVFIFVTIYICVSMFLTISLYIYLNQNFANHCYELNRLEIRKRYADYLFIRLVAEIEKINLENKQRRLLNSISNIFKIKENIQHQINEFRNDSKKLLTTFPEEFEQTPEEFYFHEYEKLDSDYLKYFYYLYNI